MSCSKAKGGGKDCVSLPMFPESSFVASGCVANLKPLPQVETPGQKAIGLFHRQTGGCFSLPSEQFPGCGSQPRTAFLIVTVPWGQACKHPLATRATRSRGIHCINCSPTSISEAVGEC